jgi:hypothetical protein
MIGLGKGGVERPMPLARYFLCVGGVLLALLFVADAWLPKLPVVDRPESFQPVIRIYSDGKWPERVVYNTGVAMSPPAPGANLGPYIPAPERRAIEPGRIREAFAQLRSSDAKSSQPVHSAKPVSRPNHRRNVARRMPPPIFRLAQRQFGGHIVRMW